MENVMIMEYVDETLRIMTGAHVVLPKEATLNVYHHLGDRQIRETGALFMNVVNSDYCKSYVVMTKGQSYPEHYHKIKHETFYVLSGTLMIELDGVEYKLESGDMLHIERGQDHRFWADENVVFEEISTTYLPNDSIYLDEDVQKRTYIDRRTVIKSEDWKEIRKKWSK